MEPVATGEMKPSKRNIGKMGRWLVRQFIKPRPLAEAVIVLAEGGDIRSFVLLLDADERKELSSAIVDLLGEKLVDG